MFYDPRGPRDFYAARPKDNAFRANTTPAERREMALGFAISLAPLVVVLIALAAMSIFKFY